ncbi:hypothetical protein CASFOL_032087 [Castilleja foliolosa]|uniref:TPX2 C-terminal domain-containing protein n=1 Tax=Castilleja foliolosa TaxID=1961234 RepID=A0ABD3C0I8_9LAMI
MMTHSCMSRQSLINHPNPMSMKQPHFHDKKAYDEDDNWSLASSTATSSRAMKLRTTVPVGPKFTIEERLEKRKEFYNKLVEKQKAIEKERVEHEARIKEEEAAAIKQLRKSMVYKANPVPSFYRQGPPPKLELKKVPVTRAKSPKLNRRNSYSGCAFKTCVEDKGLQYERATSHYRECKSSPMTTKGKGKQQIGTRKINENGKHMKADDDHPQELKGTIED